MIRSALLLLLAFLLVPAVAFAQAPANNFPVYQSGRITPGHLCLWATNGVCMDSGPAAAGNITELGITNSGLPNCINDAPISSPGGYHQLCFGANATVGTITPPSGGGGGAVVGPSLSVVNDCAVWANTTGNLLGDAPCYAINPTQSPWNCKGDAVTDDTACLQAAINAAAYGRLDLGAHKYAVSASLVCNYPMQIVGTSANQAVIPAFYTGPSGFVAKAQNITILTINSNCAGSKFSDFAINSGAAGQNTAGDAILMNPTSNITFSDVSITGPCIGVDLNGNTDKFDRIQITQVTGTGCGGIRIGHYTTGGGTVDPRITNSTIQACPVFNKGVVSNPCFSNSSVVTADYDLRMEDAGGYYLSNDDFLYGNNGTELVSGSGQYVSGWADNTDLGDTVPNTPLLIDNLGGVMISQKFTGDVVDSYASNTGAPGILIQNTGNVGSQYYNGINFVGMNVSTVTGDGLKVLAKGIPFTGSIAAGSLNQLIASSVTGTITIGSPVTGAGITTLQTVASQVSGTTGGAGVYNLTGAFITVASESMAAGGATFTGVIATGGPNLLTVSAPSGTVNVRATIVGAGTLDPQITGQNSGTIGGAGVYSVSGAPLTVSSEAMTAFSSPTFISFSGRLCGAGANNTSTTFSGIYSAELGQAVHELTLQNTRASPYCDGTISGNTDYAVKLDGDNYRLTMTGNSLYDAHYAAFSGEPVQPSDPSDSSVIDDNLGVDDQTQNYTAAATMDFGVYNLAQITGATAISVINGCVAGRAVRILPGVGGINWTDNPNVAGGLANSGSQTQAVPVNAAASGTAPCNWYLH